MNKILLFITVLCLGLGTSLNAQVVDGDFEQGIGGGWIEASTNFGTPLCDLPSCGDCGGECVPETGDFYVWIGGVGAVETGSVEQSVTIPAGGDEDLYLSVKFPTTSGLADDRLEVSVDGNVLWSITALDSTDYLDYTEVIVDIDAYADGAAHDVKIEGIQTTAAIVNFLVDNVRLGSDPLSIFEPTLEEIAISLYPNPASDVINLEFGQAKGAANVIIRDASGSEIMTEKLGNVSGKSFTFDTSLLSNGLYHVEVLTATGTASERIMVIK